MRPTWRLFVGLGVWVIQIGCGGLQDESLRGDDEEDSGGMVEDERCHGSTGENPMPDGFCDSLYDAEKSEEAANKKETEIREIPIGKGDNDGPLSVKLKDFPLITQICTNYCGPAAVKGVLEYYEIDMEQPQIAAKLRAGACNKGAGVCLTRIASLLNKIVKDKLFVTGSITSAPKNSSLEEKEHRRLENAKTLISWVVMDVKYLNQPLIVLINQVPMQLKYHFPGFMGEVNEKDKYYDPSRAHYVTLIGYDGYYDGTDGSARFLFRDSSGRNPNREWVDVNTVIECLESNSGYGSCTPDQNVIW